VTTDLYEAMRTCRAMRRLESREVPDELVQELIDLAICAPSGGDAQNWSFVVVRDPTVKHQLGVEVRKGTRWKTTVDEHILRSEEHAGRVGPEDAARRRRSRKAFAWLGRHLEDVPVLVCVCVEADTQTLGASLSPDSIRSALAEFGLWGTVRFLVAAPGITTQALWASSYPAVQNLLLGARGHGLGAVLTTPHFLGPPGRIERILGLPRGVRLAAVIPLGYPKGRFGPVRRSPPKVYADRYGRARTRAAVATPSSPVPQPHNAGSPATP
jgi:nitroreductase